MKNIFKSKKSQFFFIFFTIILIRFFPFWFLDKTLVFGDNYSLMMPGKLFTANWIKQGVLPMWNPEVFSGMPWIADISQSILHPSTLLFLIFQPAVALNLLIATHLFIAYGGMYLLSKKWGIKHGYALIAAVMWMLSTQITGSINNFSTLQAIVWLPLLGYLGLRVVKERKARWWFAVVVLFQFLGGYPQHVLYGVGLGVLLSLWQNLIEPLHKTKLSLTKFKTWFLAWLETALWVIGVSAVAWVPFLDMLLYSTRMKQSANQALVGSLNPAMLIKLAIPYFWDSPRAGMKWGPAWSGQPNVAFYVTWLGLLAVGQRLWLMLQQAFQKKLIQKKSSWSKYWSKFGQDIFSLVVIVLTLAFSLGEYLPGFSVIQKLIPLFRIARYPSMVMIMTNVILILWVVKTLQQWKFKQQQFKRLSLALMGVIVLSLIGFLIHSFWFESFWLALDSFANYSLTSSPFHTPSRDKIILFEIIKTTLFISTISLGTLLIFNQLKTQKIPKYKKTWLMMILTLYIALELGFATHSQFFFAPQNIYEVNGEHKAEPNTQLNLVKNLAETGEFDHYRMLIRNSNKPYTDYGSYWEALVVREPFSDSFVDGQELETYDHVKALRDGLTPNWNMAYGVPVVNGYTTLLPQDYAEIWNTSDEARINFIDYVDPLNEELDQWSVKYYLVDDWFKVEEDLPSLELIASEDRWKLYERVGENINPLLRFRDENGFAFSDFKIIKETPNKLVLEFNNTSNSQELIISDRWDKDWQVSVNNQKRTLKNKDGMRAVELDSGLNQIELNYHPEWFYFGSLVTAFSLSLILFMVKFGRDN